jgi:hypothetical protein
MRYEKDLELHSGSNSDSVCPDGERRELCACGGVRIDLGISLLLNVCGRDRKSEGEEKMKIKRTLKNAILMSVTAVMLAIFFLSIASVDSSSWIPFVLLCLSGGYIVIFAYANGFFEWLEYEKEDDEDVRS